MESQATGLLGVGTETGLPKMTYSAFAGYSIAGWRAEKINAGI